MKYKKRAEWGARSPRGRSPLNDATPTDFFVHHGASSTPTTVEAEMKVLREYQRQHMDDKGWSDIAYNWAVGQSGTIYECRGWGIDGGHTYGWNTKSHAVVFIGNSEDTTPSDAAIASINEVVAECERRYGPQKTRPHNAVVSTACPGKALTGWVNQGRPSKKVDPVGDVVQNLDAVIGRNDTGPGVKMLQELLFLNGWTNLAIDGDFGPKTEEALVAFQKRLGVTGDGLWGPLTATAAKVKGMQRVEPPMPPGNPAPPAPAPTPAPPVDNSAVAREIQNLLFQVDARLTAIDSSLGGATLSVDEVAEAVVTKLLQEGMLLRVAT